MQEPEPAPVPEPEPAPQPEAASEPAPAPQPEVAQELAPESSSEPQIEVISEPVIEPVIERPPEEEKAVRVKTSRTRRRTDASTVAKDADAESEEIPGPVVWEKLILDVRETLCKKTLAQAMLAAKVISFKGACLQVAFDSLYSVGESILVMRDKPLLDMRLAAIAEHPGAYLAIDRRPGLVTPAQRKRKEDADALRRETEKKPFISGILNVFDGVLTDVHHLDRDENEEVSGI